MKRSNRSLLIGAGVLAAVAGLYYYKEHIAVGDQVVVPLASLTAALPPIQIPAGVTRAAITVTATGGGNVTGNVTGFVIDQTNQVQALPPVGPVTVASSAVTGRVKNGAVA